MVMIARMGLCEFRSSGKLCLARWRKEGRKVLQSSISHGGVMPFFSSTPKMDFSRLDEVEYIGTLLDGDGCGVLGQE